MNGGIMKQGVSVSLAVLAGLLIPGAGLAAAPYYACDDLGGEKVCWDNDSYNGSGSYVVLGVRTDTNPDRVVLCDVIAGNEIMLFESGTLQDDVRVKGNNGIDWMAIIDSGTPTWCGHTYHPMSFGNRYIILDGGSGNDAIAQGAGGDNPVYGGSGNDDILLNDDEAGGYGEDGNDRIESDYIYDTDYLSGGYGCDCLQDNATTYKTAIFYCGGDDDFYQPKDAGTLNSCENDVANCGSTYYQFDCLG